MKSLYFLRFLNYYFLLNYHIYNNPLHYSLLLVSLYHQIKNIQPNYFTNKIKKYTIHIEGIDMEETLLQTVKNIFSVNNISDIDSLHKNNIVRHLRNDEYLTRLLLKFHENIPYTKIYELL